VSTESGDGLGSGSDQSDQPGGDVPDPTGEAAHRGPRIVVTAGGVPDVTQLAALVVALTPGGEPEPLPGPPAWRRAALLEGVGGASILAPSDLEVASRGRR
jgi:hypothetical protein